MLFRLLWSEWRDSNSRHPGPKPGALPTGPHPDMKLKENARCGQICGQENSTTVLPNFQRKYLRDFVDKQGSMQHLEQSNRFGVPAPKAGALPVVVSGIFLAGSAASSSADRCHSLGSLYPPPAAVVSLPNRATPGHIRLPCKVQPEVLYMTCHKKSIRIFAVTCFIFLCCSIIIRPYKCIGGNKDGCNAKSSAAA